MKTLSLPQSEYEHHAADNDGLCLACGEIQSGGCEPDAEGYPCEACGAKSVMGFEQALVAGHIEFCEETEADDEE